MELDKDIFEGRSSCPVKRPFYGTAGFFRWYCPYSNFIFHEILYKRGIIT